MLPLKTNQLMLDWLYAFPPNTFASKSKKIVYFAFASSVVITHCSSFIGGALFFWKSLSIDLNLALFALFHTIGSISMLSECITIILLRRKLTAIFKGLSRIYDESKIKILTLCLTAAKMYFQLNCNLDKSDESYPIFVDLNKRCELMWSFYINYVLIAVFIAIIAMSTTSVLLCYITYGHFDGDHAYTPFRFV